VCAFTCPNKPAKSKTSDRKTVQKNLAGDIFTIQYFPGAHKEQRKELEIGLIAVGAYGSLVVEKRGYSRPVDPRQCPLYKSAH
jgi:hypothetical protein